EMVSPSSRFSERLFRQTAPGKNLPGFQKVLGGLEPSYKKVPKAKKFLPERSPDHPRIASFMDLT
ncbi:MAG: hypothetical protein ACI3YH_07535, partial [Eubacteriales bacterium]